MRPRIGLVALALFTGVHGARAVAPQGSATVTFELPAMTGIIEGIAYRGATGDFFFGDVHRRCVWRRDRRGQISRFTRDEAALFGVFNVAVDEPRRRLWAATSMLPETAQFTPALAGRAALAVFDLESGALVATYPVPTDARRHVLGDLLLDGDGGVYLTDSIAPVIWRLSPGASRLEPFLESASFRSLQGLAVVDSGRTLIVSDYSHGLFAVDVRTRGTRLLAGPAGFDLRGVDGILARSANTILAVQNGVEPQRVLRLVLAPDAQSIIRVDPAAAALPGFDDLTLIAAGPTGAVVVANSGWALVDAKKTAAIAPHVVRIFAIGE